MKLASIVFLCGFLALPLSALAFSHPGDADFLTLPDGRNLKNVKVSGVSLSLSHGSGQSFGAPAQALFEKIRKESKEIPNYPVQWVLMDLDTHQVLEESATPSLKQFGASVSKIYVAGTLMDKQNGSLNGNQLQLMANMIVVSSNTAWTELQRQIGDGDSDRGRETIQGFTQRMGYERTRAFQGWWGNIHGNELTAEELAAYLYDTYQNRYPGAEVVWKLMHTGRTGAHRAKKYLPTSLAVGSKTGTYDGATVDPETGSSTGADGKPYTVRVRHQVIVFYAGGRQYGLAILANTGSDESAASLAGGLYREYASPGASAL
jgi:hypothetical protein